jgi:hypothetical protein
VRHWSEEEADAGVAQYSFPTGKQCDLYIASKLPQTRYGNQYQVRKSRVYDTIRKLTNGTISAGSVVNR